MLIDNLTKPQLLALADLIIGLERQVRLTPDVQQAALLGAEIINDTLALSSLERITRLGFLIQEIKGEIEIEEAVNNYQEPDNYDNEEPGEGSKI